MTIRAVLFDMDGVLIDARDWHYEALNRALDLFGMGIDRHAHLASFDGLPTRRKLEMLSAARGLPAALHGFINEMKQAYTAEIIYARCRPVFHLQYALSRLRAEGYRMAVCSNSVRTSVRLMMQLSQLDRYLDEQLCNEDAAPKPDPAIYLEAMRRMALSPEECLIVEDNPHGVQAARASGGHVMVVPSPDAVQYQAIAAAIAAAEAAS